MNEYERAFVSDCREKKQIASSAAHMKRGSRSKACSLPSDTLTVAQRKKLDGECVTYKLDKVYTYAEFKQMPADIQTEYLNRWMELFGVGVSAIEKYFWRLKPSTLYAYVARRGISGQLRHKKGGQITDVTRKALQEVAAPIWGGDCMGSGDAQTAEEAAGQLPDMPVISAKIELNRFDFDAFKLLANMFRGKSVTVNIAVQEVKNGE